MDNKKNINGTDSEELYTTLSVSDDASADKEPDAAPECKSDCECEPSATEAEDSSECENTDTENSLTEDDTEISALGDQNISECEQTALVNDADTWSSVNEDPNEITVAEAEDSEDTAASVIDDSIEGSDDEEVFPITEVDKEDNSTPEADVDAPSREPKKRTVGSRTIDTIFDFLELFIFTFVFVLLATSFIFRHSVVSGPSMMNTLQNGDKLIISDLFYEPEYGDIVVVQDYTAGITDPIVKRVIATEGQTVRITNEGITVDGTFLNEDDYIFTDGKPYSHLSRLDHTKFEMCENYDFVPGSYCEFTVPDGELFVLGDHRNISQDSYFYGNVREDSILGKVILRFYPEFTWFND